MIVLVVAVTLLIWSRSPVPVSPEGYYRPSTDESSVTVRLMIGLGDVVVDASAQETVDQVRVMVEIRSPRGARAAVGIPVEVAIPLQQPAPRSDGD